MSNTLNLGTDGNWATKENSLLGYNSESGNYKPLPFDFTRASSATVVNKSGLIETVQSGIPRIDFSDSTSGALLLEPQRTNLIEYSNLKSGWSLLSGGSIAYDQTISPDGTQNASVLSGDGINGNSIYDFVTLSAQTYIFSVFAKQKDASIISLKGFSGGAAGTSKFNLSNGTIDTVSVGQFSDEKIEDYGNGWYRCSVKITATSSGSKTLGFGGENSDSGELFSLYGAQAEQGSYSTSLINTQGSAVTRVADVCNNGGNEQVINSTEGVLYAEIAPLSNDGTNRHIGISDNSNANRLQVFFNTYPTTQVRTLNLVNNVKYFDMQSDVTLVNGYAKVAVKYKENDFALWINGVEAATDNSGLVWSNGVLDTLKFSDGDNASPFYGKTKDVRVYNTALTDAELIALTTI